MIVVAWFRFLPACTPADARPETRRHGGARDGIGGLRPMTSARRGSGRRLHATAEGGRYARANDPG